MQSVDPIRIRALRHAIVGWARLWGVPELEREVTLRTSSRFRRSLGSYRPRRAEITLAAWLVDGPGPLLNEVLCHEAAHAAVHFTYGERTKPHGTEWREFMAKADAPARVRIPVSELPEAQRNALASSRVWEHRCPVCQATRLARTRVTGWRCGRCREDGLSGKLIVERVSKDTGSRG